MNQLNHTTIGIDLGASERRTQMPLNLRIAIFTLLWLLAGLLSAIFADIPVEYGESEFNYRAAIGCLAPWCFAQGLAFVAVPEDYPGDNNTSPDRQFWQLMVGFAIFAFFVIHAVITLTRKTPKWFIIWSAIQLVFLFAGVASCLYYWHWAALHLHG